MKSPNVPYYVWKTEQEIQLRVQNLAGKIQADNDGQPLHILGVLRGCFLFMADLVRAVNLPTYSHFMNVFYRDCSPDGHVIREVERTLIHPPCDCRGKNILLISGVLDTGVIVNHLLGLVREQDPKTLKVAVLIDKLAKRKVDVQADYVAFEEEKNEHVFGYGLEYEEHHRNLPFLAKSK